MDEQKPNEKELEVLGLFYNRFYDLYDEIIDDSFFLKDEKTRFYLIRDAFSIYKELLNYEPIKLYLKWARMGGRPPLESMIADDLFSFIRNVLSHLPVYETWNDVYINSNLATWTRPGTIDKFLKKCTRIKIDGKSVVNYRIWEKSKNQMTYIKIRLPDKYENNRIYLSEIISEKDGIKFCLSLMKKVLNSQVENSDDSDISIMSQVYIPTANVIDE